MNWRSSSRYSSDPSSRASHRVVPAAFVGARRESTRAERFRVGLRALESHTGQPYPNPITRSQESGYEHGPDPPREGFDELSGVSSRRCFGAIVHEAFDPNGSRDFSLHARNSA